MSRVVLLLALVLTAWGSQGCWWLWSSSMPLKRLTKDELGKKHSSVVLLRLRVTDETGRFKDSYQRITFRKVDGKTAFLPIWNRVGRWTRQGGVYRYEGLFMLTAEAGRYKLINFHLPGGTTYTHGRRTRHFFRITLNQTFEVPPNKIVYLGTFHAILTHGPARIIRNRLTQSLGAASAIRDVRQLSKRFPKVCGRLSRKVVYPLRPRGPLWKMRTGCTAGKAVSCNRLGLAFSRGRPVAKNPVAAVQFFRRACELGSSFGCFNLGYCHLTGSGVVKNTTIAARHLTKACRMNHGLACTHLGLSYERGRGVQQDHTAAVRLYSKACRLQHAMACSNLANMLMAGRGGTKDPPAALRYYRLACGKGLAHACNALGVQYSLGKVVPKDLKTAVKLYAKACSGKSMWGCYNLAHHLQQGSGIAADSTRASRLFRWACSQGHRKACNRIQATKERPK